MPDIRPMREEDVKRVSALERHAFSMPWKEKDFRDMMRTDYAYYYVAEIEGMVVGCCGILNLAGEGEVTNVVVDPALRKQGIGGKLLACAMQDSMQKGVTAFTLEVRVSNTEAIGLYHKLGFTEEGIRPGFYEKPQEDALIMWKR